MANKKAKTLKKFNISFQLDMNNPEEKGIADVLPYFNTAKLSEEVKGSVLKSIRRVHGDIGRKLSTGKQADDIPAARADTQYAESAEASASTL